MQSSGSSAPVARTAASSSRSLVLEADVPPSALCEVANEMLLLQDAGRSDGSLGQGGAVEVSTPRSQRLFGWTKGVDDADSLIGEDDQHTPLASHVRPQPVLLPGGGVAEVSEAFFGDDAAAAPGDDAGAGAEAALVQSVLDGLKTLKANFVARLLRCSDAV